MKQGAWIKLPPNSKITPELINIFHNSLHCIKCRIATMNKLPRQLGSGIRPKLGTQLSYDYIGPLPSSVLGHTGIHLFMELTVNYLLYDFTKVKNNFIEVMYKVLPFFHSLNFRIDTIRFDYDKVENSQTVLAFL